MTSLLDGLDDSLDIERLDGAEVDDLSLDTVLRLELLGSNKALADTAGKGDNSQVLSRTLNLGLAELYELLADVVHLLMMDSNIQE